MSCWIRTRIFNSSNFCAFRSNVVKGIALSQAIPALKGTIDHECSGNGLVSTENNPPDFGLLILAHFVRFSIRTEIEVTVHTHSQTNRQGSAQLVSVLEIESSKVDLPSLDLWSVTKVCMQRSVPHVCENLPRSPFCCLRITDFVDLFSVWLPRGFWNVAQKPKENQGGAALHSSSVSHRVYRSKLIESYRARSSMTISSSPCRGYCFHTPHLRDRQWWRSTCMFHFIRLFKFRKRKSICSLYAKLLRCTVYDQEAALT